MLDSILKDAISSLITIVLSVVASNADRFYKYYKRRISWFRPEFDIRPNESFYIVTSSKKEIKSKDLSPQYVARDKTVIGDVEPVLISLGGKSIKLQHYLPERLQNEQRRGNIISFGGEKRNGITRLLLDGLECPLRFDEYRIVDKRDHNAKYTPKWDKDGRIRTDYALLVRAPNPYNRDLNTTVYIFAGIHKPGTLGAAWLTNSKYSKMINDQVQGMDAFVILAEIQVNYNEPDVEDPLVTPKSIIRVYDLPNK